MNRKAVHLYKRLMDRLMRVNRKVDIPAMRGAAAIELAGKSELLSRS